MLAIEATICVIKPEARGFALIVLVAGLAARLGTIASSPAIPFSKLRRRTYLAVAVGAIAIEVVLTVLLGHSPLASGISCLVAFGVGYVSNQTQAYRERLVAEAAPVPIVPKRLPMMLPGAYKPKERILVPTTGNPRLLDFAIKESKTRQAELAVLFVRHLAVTPMGPTGFPRLDEDAEALDLFDQLRTRAREAGVPLRLLYGVARDIPDAILDMAVTHGADLLILGTTRRGTLWRAMKGDVIQTIAEQLPGSIDLLIHAGAADREEEVRTPPATAAHA
jgi:nucleotide-binding universal stress UspA family protein